MACGESVQSPNADAEHCTTQIVATHLAPLGAALARAHPHRVPVRRQSLLPLPLTSHRHGLLLAQTADLVLQSQHLLLEGGDLGVPLPQEGLGLLVGDGHDLGGPVAGFAGPAPVPVGGGVAEHVHIAVGGLSLANCRWGKMTKGAGDKKSVSCATLLRGTEQRQDEEGRRAVG